MSDTTSAKAESLMRRIEDALDKLVTLSVVTAVMPLRTVFLKADGAPTDVMADARRWELWPAGGGAEGMATEINLVAGDIRNTISTGFAGDDRKSLRDFHLQQVTQSRTIVHDNISAVLDLARSLRAQA
jgi:hypothetical protein